MDPPSYDRQWGAPEQGTALRADLFEHAPFFVAVLQGPRHVFVRVNAAYRRLVGERVLIGRTVAEGLPEAEAQGLIELLDHVFTTGEAHVAEEVPVRLEEVPGEPRDLFLDFVYYPIADDDGRVRGIHVHGTDVTEQVRARARLEQQETQLRAVLESALDAAYRRDLIDDRYDYLSPVIERLVGFAPREMEAMSTEEVLRRIHPDDRTAIRTGIERGAAEGRGTVEYRFRARDGRYRWLADHFTVQYDGDGRPCFRSGVVRDITERRRTEEALRRSEARYRRLLATANEGIWLVDIDGWTQYANEKMAAMLGCTVEELETSNLFDFVFDEDREATLGARTRRSEGAREAFDARYRRADGSTLWGHVTTSPVSDEDGTFVGAFAMITDITERRRAEEELQQLNASLERRVSRRTRQVRALASRLTMAEQEERRRISQVLHDDLQQLLYGVEMRMSMLGRDLEAAAPDLVDDLDRARALVERAVDTTRRLTVDLSPPILRNEGLADALAWLQRQMRELHGLDISIEADDAVPVMHDGLRVLLFQIVRELLFNVVKHAGVDGAAVRLAEERGEVVIEVADRGRGFDVERRWAGEEREGGLGLRSARERLELLGGSLHLHSRPGTGTRAEVRVPASAVRDDTPASQPG